MINLKKCWAVVSGSYSDYRVLAVCLDEATAKKWAAALNGGSGYSDASVEKMDLIPVGAEPETVHSVLLMQNLWDDGREEEFRVAQEDVSPIDNYYGIPPVQPSSRFVRAPMHAGRGGRLEIRGRDLKSVMKVHSEQRAVWKSSPSTYRRGSE